MTTFHELLRAGAQKYGSRVAIQFESDAVSYETLLLRTESLAAGIQSRGMTGADHVAIIMDNSLECVLAWLALSVVGCTDIPINPQYRGDLLLYLLHHCEANAVICDASYFPQVASLAGKLPGLRIIIVNGKIDSSPHASIQSVCLDSCAHETRRVSIELDASERVVLYTSGTTGPSRGVVHTQRSCMVLSQYNAQVLAYDKTDRLLNFFPLYHMNARYTGVIPALCVGASIRLQRKLSTSTFWKTCDADGITAFNYMGSVLRLILNTTPPERVVGRHTLRKAFGSGASSIIREQFEKRLGIQIVEAYGLTEAPMATLNAGGQDRQLPRDSAGRASDLFEVAIVDSQDRFAEPGELGEIVMRPRQPDAIMVGYLKNDAATVRSYRNLWFHSGDLGRLSEQGDLYFDGREKDSIRRRGENISAWEVESVLDQHPDVAESAVFGVSSEDYDEEVAAAIVLHRPDASLASICAFAEEHLPNYAVPTLFRVLLDLPRTPTLKVQKGQLRRAERLHYIAASDLRTPSKIHEA